MQRKFVLGIVAVIVVVALGAGAWWWRGSTQAPAPGTAPTAQAIPVTLAKAERKNVAVNLTGLGTVQAFNTVTVKARVDGEVVKVAFEEGQQVNAGDLLAQIDPKPFQAAVDMAQAAKGKDEAQLENARADLQRFRTAGTLANTQQQIDTQAALVRELTATVQADQANVEAAQIQLDYATIKAPISGRAGLRQVDQGNIVHAADTTGLVVLTQLQPISVVLTIPQDQLHEIIQQMSASSTPLQVFAQGRDGRQLGAGTLTVADNLIDQTTGNARLKATFPNTDNALWPGQFLNVRLLLKTLQQVVTVPSTAVQRGPSGYYVYVVGPDSKVAMQTVEVGQMDQGISVIEKGLSEGTTVVASGQYRLQPGSQIESAALTADRTQ